MEIYLSRHTPVDCHPELCYGHTDVPLKENYLEDFKAIKSLLPSSFDQIYSSPSKRCVQLARFINPKIQQDEALRELNFGDWENKLWTAIPYEESANWMNNYVSVAPPNGESLLSMFHRVTQFIDQLRTAPYQRTLIVTHAGVIRCILGYILQTPLNSLFKIQVRYGKIYHLNIDPKPELDWIEF